jgi:hypothetical protein
MIRYGRDDKQGESRDDKMSDASFKNFATPPLRRIISQYQYLRGMRRKRGFALLATVPPLYDLKLKP